MPSEFIVDLVDHKQRVTAYMQIVATELFNRASIHDNSKFSPEEFEAYEEAFPGLQKYAYGSDEFKAELKKIEPAIQHHYSVNDHHPEHFIDGVLEMNLFQIMEMVCDQMAASDRSQTDVFQGMEINKKRFGIEPQLAKIITNTIIDLREKRIMG